MIKLNSNNKYVLFSKPKPLYEKDPSVGFISIFCSQQSKTLRFWECYEGVGQIRSTEHSGIRAVQILKGSTPTQKTCLAIPKKPHTTLGITLPNMALVVKNINRGFEFDVQILDSSNTRRRFQFGTRHVTARKRPNCTCVPLGWFAGWNKIPVDLQECTKKAYGTDYVQTIRVQIYPCCELRLVYFTQAPMPLEQALFIMKVLCIENEDTFDLSRFNESGTLIGLRSHSTASTSKPNSFNETNGDNTVRRSSAGSSKEVEKSTLEQSLEIKSEADTPIVVLKEMSVDFEFSEPTEEQTTLNDEKCAFLRTLQVSLKNQLVDYNDNSNAEDLTVEALDLRATMEKCWAIQGVSAKTNMTLLESDSKSFLVSDIIYNSTDESETERYEIKVDGASCFPTLEQIEEVNEDGSMEPTYSILESIQEEDDQDFDSEQLNSIESKDFSSQTEIYEFTYHYDNYKPMESKPEEKFALVQHNEESLNGSLENSKNLIVERETAINDSHSTRAGPRHNNKADQSKLGRHVNDTQGSKESTIENERPTQLLRSSPPESTGHRRQESQPLETFHTQEKAWFKNIQKYFL